MRRLVAILCCAILLCCVFAGCSPTPDTSSDASVSDRTDSEQVADTATLAFNREDTLDPFSAKTQLNVYLSALLYDSLVSIGTDFMPQNSMAKVEQTDATHITATLKNGLKFSDGSAVTAADVIYSFELAKNSDHYKARLRNVKTVTAKGKTLTLTLQAADKYGVACLDFPIIKKNTATDKAASAPIGSGPYVYHADNATLTLNPHAGIKQANIHTVTLRHLVSNASVLQALENGSIQYMYNDLSDGNIPRTTAKAIPVEQAQLVYIGVNSRRAPLSTAAYRKALSGALDRTAISAAAYTGRAHAATSPFHPEWKPTFGLSCIAAGSNTALATSLIKEALTATTTAPTVTSTTTASTTASTTAAATDERTLTLIYPSGNSCREAAVKMIVSQLGAAGVTVISTPLAYEEYLARLQAGNYDLYLGEIRLSPHMDLSILLQAGGAAAFGVDTSLSVVSKYAAFREGTEAAAAFVTAFGEDMPYIPVCWRQGMVAVSAALPDIHPTAYNLFKGFIQ